MGKTDWKGEGKPVFNSQKFGIVKSDPANPGKQVVVEPQLANNSSALVKTPAGGRAEGFMPHFVDGSDAMANKGMTISFQHVPSEEDVTFKAFITAFNETYNSDWASESVFGRSDPIHMFKNTQREITLAFNIPASSEGESFENLARVQRLITFLYPTYASDGSQTTAGNQADVTNALTISNSPLVRLRVMNILAARPQIGDADGSIGGGNGGRSAEAAVYSTLGTFDRHVKDGGAAAWPTTSIGSNTIAGNYHGGLLGIIKNVSVNHNLDNPDHGVFEINQGTILPKMIEVNLTFSAIHEHTLGWFNDGNGSQTFANQLFPYGVNDASKFGEGGLDSMGPADPATLRNENNLARDKLTGRLDEMAEEVEQFEQDIANAEARYAGLFGKARFNKDISSGRYKDNEYIKSAVRGRATQNLNNATNSALRSAGADASSSTLDTYRDTGMEDNYEEFIK
jgi:hypothetical protein|tara:strand:- start:354 stop:1721 length:1368 start_codon:yes stop_codon:yes gene_type:complete